LSHAKGEFVAREQQPQPQGAEKWLTTPEFIGASFTIHLP
jgi:hypothetical protein